MQEDHEHFMRLALQDAQAALSAGEFPVGCVLVRDSVVLARGARQHSRTNTPRPFELDHAEIVALRDLEANHPDIDRSAITVYSTMEPCLMCYSTLLVNNITRIVYAYEDVMGGGTGLSLATLTPLYRELKISLTPGILRRESLELFRNFFRDPANDYWRDSLLANYTLSQS